jgi:hypothetical protein
LVGSARAPGLRAPRRHRRDSPAGPKIDRLSVSISIQTTEYYYIATYRAVSRTAAAMSRNEPLAEN